MKHFLSMISLVTVLFLVGCGDALVEEVKNTVIDESEPDITYGMLFDTVFRETQWDSAVKEDGTQAVTVSGLFDWKEGAGIQQSTFELVKNPESGKWYAAALTVGSEEMTSPFTVGISFLLVYTTYKEKQNLMQNQSALPDPAAAAETAGK